MIPSCVLLTECMVEPGPEIARRLAETGVLVILNSSTDGTANGDLLQEITEAGGRAIACSLDPGNRRQVEEVMAFVTSFAGPLMGIVLQPGVNERAWDGVVTVAANNETPWNAEMRVVRVTRSTKEERSPSHQHAISDEVLRSLGLTRLMQTDNRVPVEGYSK